MKKPRLAWIFADAFAACYLDRGYFQRLAELARGYCMSKFRPLLGYSHAIVPAILTGRAPGETNIWNIYEFASGSSPFQWTERIPARQLLDRQPILRFAANRLISYVTGYNTANVPLSVLSKLTVGSQTNAFLHEIGPHTPSLLSHARKLGFSVSFHGYPRIRDDRNAIRSASRRIGIDDFVICYLTGLDKAGHALGPDSQSMRSYCEGFDSRVSGMISNVAENGYNIVLSSDHGMTSVDRRLDLPRLLGPLADEVAYFADSTIARFHDLSERRLKEVRDVLDSLGTGKTYDLLELKETGLEFSDRRFGDLFYVCDPGTVIVPSAFSVLPSNVRGMHGYDPSTVTEAGLVMSDIGTERDAEMTYTRLHDAIAGFFERSGE